MSHFHLSFMHFAVNQYNGMLSGVKKTDNFSYLDVYRNQLLLPLCAKLLFVLGANDIPRRHFSKQLLQLPLEYLYRRDA